MSRMSRWNLPAMALDRPIGVAMLVVTCMVVGLVSWNRLPLEFVVQFWRPALHVSIAYPGAQPAQVEREVTVPAEGLFKTIPGIREISSRTSQSRASITMRFEQDADLAVARAEIRDRIERLRGRLPDAVEDIGIYQWGLEDAPVMRFALFRDTDEDALAEYARRVLPARLQRVPGVANVEVTGTWRSHIYVEFERDTLNSLGISPQDISAALRANNIDMGVGKLRGANRSMFVRVDSEITSFEDLGKMVVSPNGLRLKDVAALTLRQPEGADSFMFDDKRGVFVSILKDSTANTVETCDGVHAELERLSDDPMLAGAEFHVFHDQSKHIKLALDTLFLAGQYGIIMAFFVLWLFLRKLRATLVVALVIPSSLLIAPAYIYFTGGSLNLITIVAMLISIGILVDNAIVVVENIHRHQELGLTRRASALVGAREVGLAITAATLTTLVVFIPIIYLDAGELSTLLKQFAGPIIGALLASLVLALTVIPATESRLRDRVAKSDAPETRWQRLVGKLPRLGFIDRLKGGYRATLGLCLRNPLAAICSVAALLVLTAIVPFPQTGFRGFPGLDFRQLWVSFETAPNYGAEKTKEDFHAVVVDYLKEHREELGIRNLLVREWSRGGSVQVFLVEAEDLAPGEAYPMTTDEVRQAIFEALPERLPGAVIRCGVPSSMPDPTGEVHIAMRGEDSQTLFNMSEDLVTMLESLPEVTTARPTRTDREQEIRLHVDNAAAYATGVTPTQIASSVSNGLNDTSMLYIKEQGKELQVTGRFSGNYRRTIGDLESILTMSDGGAVPVINLVEMRQGLAPGYIEHENGQTVSGVSAETEIENLAEVRESVSQVIDSFDLPPGYEISVDRSFQQMDETLASFWSMIGMSAVLIYLLLAALFESFLLPLSVLTTVPLAFVGVYWSLYLSGTSLDTIALVGSVLLCGVIVNNGIVIVDQINRLRADGMSRTEAILTGGANRLRPVLMTTLTTVLGILPLALGGDAGSATDAVAGLGRALVGGLAAGTLLTLFVVPMVYQIIDDSRAWIRNFSAAMLGLG